MDDNTKICVKCHYSCSECTGIGPADCSECPPSANFRKKFDDVGDVNTAPLRCVCEDTYYDNGVQ